MNKKYYFLVGLPRAGNTLLSSILNQNKNISVSANSPISEILYNLEVSKSYDIALQNFPDYDSFDNIQRNIFINYYQNRKANIIIDRSAWGTPDNFNILKKYCPNEIKMVVLVRDILEVLASFIKWSKENPNNFIDKISHSTEEQCNFLMNPNGQIVRELLAIDNLLKEDKKYSHFIDYNEFVANPYNHISKIYDYLKIPRYNHQLKNFTQFSANSISYDDRCLGNNLHTIRTSVVSKINYSIADYLPKLVIEKYKHYNIWK